MELKFHKTLIEDKWAQYPFHKQILMVANELNRAKNWIERNDFDEVSFCYERALELLYLTVATLQDKRRLKELLRFKEILSSLYIKKNPTLQENVSLLKVLLSLSKDSDTLLSLPA